MYQRAEPATMQLVIDVKEGDSASQLHQKLRDEIADAQLRGDLRYSEMGFIFQGIKADK